MANAASDLGEALSPYVCAVLEQIEQLKDLNLEPLTNINLIMLNTNRNEPLQFWLQETQACDKLAILYIFYYR